MEIHFTPSKEDVFNALQAAPRSTWNSFIFVLFIGTLFVIGIYLVDHDFSLIGYSWLAMSLLLTFAMYEIPRFRAQRDLARNLRPRARLPTVLRRWSYRHSPHRNLSIAVGCVHKIQRDSDTLHVVRFWIQQQIPTQACDVSRAGRRAAQDFRTANREWASLKAARLASL